MVILVAYAIMGSGLSAIVAISLTYFFMSIMFPTIFALSIKNLGDQVKLGSGLVIMAIVGGADTFSTHRLPVSCRTGERTYHSFDFISCDLVFRNDWL